MVAAETLERRELMVASLDTNQDWSGDGAATTASEQIAVPTPQTLDMPVAEVNAEPTLWMEATLFSEVGLGEVSTFSAPSQLTPADATDGRTTITLRDEPFANYSAGFSGVRYVKGHLLLSDPSTVYFQDSVKYAFHYDFATERLAPFLHMTRDQFDAVTLDRAGQQVVMFTVLISPDSQELAVQIVGHDPYPREDVANWIHTIASSVQSDSPVTVLYMPAYEQTAAAQADSAWFQSQGIIVADAARWVRGNVTYAEGWATGRLVKIPTAQISAAYGDGRLKPTDILLLTDGVPAEIPYVRGVLTLTPATPNSHVAILARNQQLPFAWVQNAAEQQRLLQLAGSNVLLRASNGRVDVAQLDQPFEPAAIADWLADLQTPDPAHITPKESYGSWLEDATDLTPDLIKYFGGKASNYGLLRRTIPDSSQRAMAFSFDLWDAFMSNINPATGRTLREEIDLRLGSFSYPPDMSLARQKLAEVNTLIRKTVKWTDAQRMQILNELINGFPDVPHDKFLRFRSSSNAEDSQELTGAGLYDSFSGCLADDLDGDSVGPSKADPNEPDEKGVFRAIEKVFASFYNENAWLERLRHGVNEHDTGLAILVHQNFPDALEMANGVVTFKYSRTQWGDTTEVSYAASIVTQLGAMSVTNPEGGAIAEEVNAFFGPGQTPYLYMKTASTLVPLGDTVMEWETDYPELMDLIAKVAEGYSDLYPNKDEFTLDLEFKRMIPGKLIVKQVREIPTATPEFVTPKVVNETTDWRVLQSEFSDVWSNHRLKSQMSLSTINGSLDSGSNPLTRLTFTLLDGATSGAQAIHVGGAPGSLPGAAFESTTGEFVNRFRLGTGDAARSFELTTTYPAQVDEHLSPVITPSDFTQELKVRYSSPVPWLDATGPATRYDDRVLLVPAKQLTPDSQITTRTFRFGDVQITTRFQFWKPEGELIVKTLPVAAWVDTVITGLTTEPITLRSDFAQTYGPGHHNFSEQFIFEPGLDPSLTARQKSELAAKNVRLLHVFHDTMTAEGGGATQDRLTILGVDGALRIASQVTLPTVNLNVGSAKTLAPVGVDGEGRSFTFRNPVWEVSGGGTMASAPTLTKAGPGWVFSASEPGVWELTVTDPQQPGIVGRATVLVAGVTLDWSGTLQIVGSPSDDKVTLDVVGGTSLRVQANYLKGASRSQLFPLDQVYQIAVYGGAGRDFLNASSINLPVTLDGGDGDDKLRGGGGDDLLIGGAGDDSLAGGRGSNILLGGAGNDWLWSEGGPNLLIGGDGRDTLFAGNKEDILVTGKTMFSDPSGGFGLNRQALQAILQEWKSGRSGTARRANLTGRNANDDRLNDNYFLELGSTALDDGRSDSIVGGGRRHWKITK